MNEYKWLRSNKSNIYMLKSVCQWRRCKSYSAMVGLHSVFNGQTFLLLLTCNCITLFLALIKKVSPKLDHSSIHHQKFTSLVNIWWRFKHRTRRLMEGEVRAGEGGIRLLGGRWNWPPRFDSFCPAFCSHIIEV